jgi:hypothetical protein
LGSIGKKIYGGKIDISGEEMYKIPTVNFKWRGVKLHTIIKGEQI